MTDHDANWADLARGSRGALADLGYHIAPGCLPDEAEPCGANYTMHVAAHLAVIRAVIEHHAEHLGKIFTPMMEETYKNSREQLIHDCQFTSKCAGKATK
jgi:hypothetical protein